MEREETIAKLRAARPVISPSLLKCDYGHLAAEIAQLESGAVSLFHWDVMDGHFVPNLSYGAPVIASLRPTSRGIFDAHLMISEPERYLDDFLKAGADIVTIHAEVESDVPRTLSRIREAGRVAGLAINPDTSLAEIESYLPECDLLLVMTVHPGFGGQKFMSKMMPKMAALRQRAPEHLISVDGGISAETIGEAARAGADIFVAGSAVLGTRSYESAMSELRRLAEEGGASPRSARA